MRLDKVVSVYYFNLSLYFAKVWNPKITILRLYSLCQLRCLYLESVSFNVIYFSFVSNLEVEPCSAICPSHYDSTVLHQSHVPLLEEKEHLQEMEDELSLIPEASTYIESVCQIEACLFEKWLAACRLFWMGFYTKKTHFWYISSVHKELIWNRWYNACVFWRW